MFMTFGLYKDDLHPLQSIGVADVGLAHRMKSFLPGLFERCAAFICKMSLLVPLSSLKNCLDVVN